MLIDMNKVYRQTNLENLDQAFTVAERDLGVTRLLDPEGTRWGRVPVPAHSPFLAWGSHPVALLPAGNPWVQQPLGLVVNGCIP